MSLCPPRPSFHQLLHPTLGLCAQAALSQTLQRVHAAFECLVDIVQAQQQLCPAAEVAAPAPEVPADRSLAAAGNGATAEAVLLGIAHSLLALGEGGRTEAGVGALLVHLDACFCQPLLLSCLLGALHEGPASSAQLPPAVSPGLPLPQTPAARGGTHRW